MSIPTQAAGVANRAKTRAKHPKRSTRTSISAAPVPSKSRAKRNRHLTQSTVASNFLATCRETIKDQLRTYVKDKSGKYYLTLDPVARHLNGVILDVSAQQFKDNFSRFSSLIKCGLQVRLSLRGSEAFIYARRHLQYQDPLESIMKRWQEQAAEAASHKEQETRVLRAISGVGRQDESQTKTILQDLKQLKLGVARLGIGHRPFDEGQLPGNDPRPDQDEE